VVKQKQFKITLPDDLRARLEAAAAKSGRSIADEIRVRVEAALKRDELDKPTRDLLEGLALFPAEIALETGAAWHKHAGAWMALLEAIRRRMSRLVRLSNATETFGARPHRVSSADDPHEVGRWIEQILFEHPDFTDSEMRRGLERGYRVIREFDEEKEGKRK
jgi:plasmid stability protein